MLLSGLASIVKTKMGVFNAARRSSIDDLFPEETDYFDLAELPLEMLPEFQEIIGEEVSAQVEAPEITFKEVIKSQKHVG